MTTLPLRCLIVARSASPLHSTQTTLPACWSVSCRYYASRRPHRGRRRTEDYAEDFADTGFDEGEDRRGKKSSAFQISEKRMEFVKGAKVEYTEIEFRQHTKEYNSQAPTQPFNSTKPQPQSPKTATSLPRDERPSTKPKNDISWNVPKPNKFSPQEPANHNNTETAQQTIKVQNSTTDAENEVQVEFMRFQEEIKLKELRLQEYEQKEEQQIQPQEEQLLEGLPEGQPEGLSEGQPEGLPEGGLPELPPEKHRKAATKSFERFILLHFISKNALPSDIRRSILKQYGIEPTSLSTFMDYRGAISWVLEFETEEQVKTILDGPPFRFEWQTPSMRAFTLDALPPKYEGKAVLITNLDNSVSTGDISGFLQDYGVITVENVKEHLRFPEFLVKVSSEDAAQAIVLMFHNYQYGKRLMGVYQLF